MAPPSGGRRTLLVVGDAIEATGFSRVVHSVLERLGNRWDVHILALNYRRPPPPTPWTVHIPDLVGDVRGWEKLKALARNVRPDLVMLYHDIRVSGFNLKQLRAIKPRPATVMYCPVEGEFTRLAPIRKVRDADRLVTFTEFGRRAFLTAEAQMRDEDPEFRLPPISIIPHGVDVDVFRPLPEAEPRLRARARLFADEPGLADAFVVLNANRNQPRKRIDLTLRGFARFARDKPAGVRLCLHMGRRDYGVDLEDAGRQLGIRHRLLMTSDARDLPSACDDRLNLVYNACDVGLNTSMGEGWGLISFEHAATRAAQIVPRHSVGPELWPDGALFLESDGTYARFSSYMENVTVAVDSVAGCLERLYRDPGERTRLAAAAFHNATRPEYRWDLIAARWEALFDEVLAAAPSRPSPSGGCAGLDSDPTDAQNTPGKTRKDR